MPQKASIIIPVYGAAPLTRQCLESILQRPSADVDAEIIVVDDASPDSTPTLLASYGERIRVVRHEANRGFAISCNDGAAAARSDYLVFLNNDTITTISWLDNLIGYAENHPEASVVGTKLLYPNNTIQHAGVVIRQDRNPWHIYCGFPHDHPAVNKSRRFPIVTAGCVLIRRSVFDELNGFNAEFINGYEDVDFCLRAGQIGHEIHYCHESVIYHFEGLTREGRTDQVEYNTRLYKKKWMDKVVPDDFRYYLEDGLIDVSYSRLYPAHFTISPLLANINTQERERQADRILHLRSQQVFDLMRENVKLNVRVTEAAVGRDAATVAEGREPRHALPAEPHLIARPKPFSPGTGTRGLVSVLIPVKNGGASLGELLARLREQKTERKIEVIAVDSGSDDDSIPLLERHGAGIVVIDSHAFAHGATRNLASSYARGEALVYLTQRALPADLDWLENLLAPLDSDSAIAGVCSRVLPREDADVLTRKDGMRDPSGSPERQVRSIEDWNCYRALPHHQLRLLINFHTVSCAIRPLVLARFPFRDTAVMGEDIQWAKDVLEAGFKIQHEPSSRVYHSHSYSYFELLQRCYDDGASNREIVGRTLSDQEIIPLITFLIRDDWKYLREEAGLRGAELEEWQITSALRRTAQIVGQWLGVRADDLGSRRVAEVFSLTGRIVEGLLPKEQKSGEEGEVRAC